MKTWDQVLNKPRFLKLMITRSDQKTLYNHSHTKGDYYVRNLCKHPCRCGHGREN